MNNKKLLVAAIAASIAATVTFAPITVAKEVTSAKQANNAITFRKSLFQLIRSNIGPMGAMARGKMPYDQALLSKNAERMTQLAAMVPDYMASDTSKFNDDSDAKVEIWQNKDDFNAKAEAFYQASKALQAVVASGEESAYRGAIGKLSSTCKGCHDDFKS